MGTACGREEITLSSNSIGVHEELIAFASGKEFSLLQTASGKVRFTLLSSLYCTYELNKWY